MQEFDSPKFAECKCCGVEAVVPMQLHNDQEVTGEEHSVMFFKCLICNDTWTSEKISDEKTQVSFHHQIDMKPALRRRITTDNEVLLEMVDEEDWDYFVGDEQVEMEEWYDILESRRDELYSSAVN